MEWLTRPLTSDGLVVAGPLDLARLTDADLPGICMRMRAILDNSGNASMRGSIDPARPV